MLLPLLGGILIHHKSDSAVQCMAEVIGVGSVIIIGGIFLSLWSTFENKGPWEQNGCFIEPVAMVTSSLQWGWRAVYWRSYCTPAVSLTKNAAWPPAVVMPPHVMKPHGIKCL